MNEANNEFTHLNDEDADEFTLQFRLSNTPLIHAEVEGERKDADRWGENKYAVDARVHIYTDNVENWDVTEELVDDFTDELKRVLSESIGYSGPIVVRSNEDELCRSWARRLVKTQNEENSTDDEG